MIKSTTTTTPKPTASGASAEKLSTEADETAENGERGFLASIMASHATEFGIVLGESGANTFEKSTEKLPYV